MDSAFPEKSAFGQAQDNKERFTEEQEKAFAERLARQVLPTEPVPHEASGDLNVESIHYQLDRASLLLEAGNVTEAQSIINEVCAILYSHLR